MYPRRLVPRTIASLSPMLRNGLATLKGRATIQATREFIDQSDLKLYIGLNQSSLTINPVIHGSPRHILTEDKGYYTTLAKRAVLINRSNCLVVYDHKRGKPWALDGLSTIICPENKLRREHIVTVADLGLAASNYDLYGRLADACKQTGLQMIDIAMFEVNNDIMMNKPDRIQEAVNALSELILNQSIQAFGIKVSVSPYIHHNPPVVRTYGEGTIFPSNLEDFMRGEGLTNDLVFYNISPTTFQPATYPMLTSSEHDSSEEKSSEDTRTFTRVACDPLICLRGTGKVISNAEEETEQVHREQTLAPIKEQPISPETELPLISGLQDKEVEKVIGGALDQLCPKLVSTPRLQDKALRTVLSVGIDAVLMDAEMSSLMGKLQLTTKDLLTPQDTEGVYGAFTLPEGLIGRK